MPPHPEVDPGATVVQETPPSRLWKYPAAPRLTAPTREPSSGSTAIASIENPAASSPVGCQVAPESVLL